MILNIHDLFFCYDSEEFCVVTIGCWPCCISSRCFNVFRKLVLFFQAISQTIEPLLSAYQVSGFGWILDSQLLEMFHFLDIKMIKIDPPKLVSMVWNHQAVSNIMSNFKLKHFFLRVTGSFCRRLWWILWRLINVLSIHPMRPLTAVVHFAYNLQSQTVWWVQEWADENNWKQLNYSH